jgi:hypothetical protein
MPARTRTHAHPLSRPTNACRARALTLAARPPSPRRFGSISSYRLLGSYGAAALSLESPHAASSALRSLHGATMLMRPLSATLLSDFPDDEHLSAGAQALAMRTMGTGTAYREAMGALWQELRDLPSPVR